ncbi:unnamed protein product [Rhizophagus irregularis]|nr:unnamed protein product [Rhizophagus irregularis]
MDTESRSKGIGSGVNTESQRISVSAWISFPRNSAPTRTPIFQVQLSVLDFLGFGYILGFDLKLWIYGFSFRFLGVEVCSKIRQSGYPVIYPKIDQIQIDSVVSLD